MALIDELKERRKMIDAEIEGCNWRIGCERDLIDMAIAKAHELDTAIAALEPAPAEPEAEPEPKYQTYRNADDMGYPSPIRDEPVATSYPNPYWEIRYTGRYGPAVQRWHERSDADLSMGAFEQGELWSFDPNRAVAYVLEKCWPDEQPADQSEEEPSEFISDLTGDPAIEPESGLHGEPTHDDLEYVVVEDELSDPEPTELDAPASIVDDPELQAAVARAEATLAAEPAYVGLQDPELEREYDAMKEREEAAERQLKNPEGNYWLSWKRKLEEVS